MKIKVQSLFALLLFGLGALVRPVALLAEPSGRLKSLTVSAWLEYDRPGVLYIYEGELPEGTSFPAQVSFRLPKSSGGPSSTAGIDAAGNFRYIRPILSEEGDSIIVTYEINWPRFQIEYYDDSLQRQEQSHQLDLVYRADYAIDQLFLEVKEPYAATNWTLDPAGSTQSRGEDNLTVHRRDIGPAAPGQEIRWKASYTKSDSRLASEALGFPTPPTSKYEAGTGIPQPAPASDRVPLLVLFLVAIAALGGLAFWYRSKSAGPDRIRPRPPGTLGPAPRRRRRNFKQRKTAGPSQGQVIGYCHLCGTAFLEGDAFCRQCGTRRRMD